MTPDARSRDIPAYQRPGPVGRLGGGDGLAVFASGCLLVGLFFYFVPKDLRCFFGSGSQGRSDAKYAGGTSGLSYS